MARQRTRQIVPRLASNRLMNSASTRRPRRSRVSRIRPLASANPRHITLIGVEHEDVESMTVWHALNLFEVALPFPVSYGHIEGPLF